MTEAALRISQVQGWDVGVFDAGISSLGIVVAKFDGLLASMLIKQDDLAESWNGAGADAAASRVVSDKTAGDHISAKIDAVKTVLETAKTDLQAARDFVLTKRNNFVEWGFEVDDRGIVAANAKIKELRKTGMENGAAITAGLELMAEAGRYSVELLGALQYAKGVATSVQTKLQTATAELNTLVATEAPSKVMRDLGIGRPSTDTTPGSLIPSPLEATQALSEGKEVRVPMPDGSTRIITPNADGSLTVAQSVTGPDGTTTITTSTNGGPSTTTVMTPRADGSGIIDTTVTDANGTTQRSRTIPTVTGRNETYAISPDGTVGAKLSESYRADDGGIVTDTYRDGVIDRQWKGPDGFTANERYAIGPDGQQVLVGTSNSAQMTSVLQPDGSIQTTYPDGRSAITRELADGKVVTEFSDKSVLAYDPKAAAPGIAQQSPWDVVKAWSGGHATGFVDSTVGTVETHPWASGAGVAAAGGGEAVNQVGKTMADQAAGLAGNAAAKQIIANSMLDAGTPGAGRAAIQALDASADAAGKAGAAGVAGAAAKALGWPATIGINSYINYDDWKNGKPADEAIANAAGGTLGGMGGAAAGAWLGTQFCSPAVLTGVGAWVPLACAAGGAALGGFLGGAGGAYVAEQPFK
ncbi:hypothetical protein [Nocardia farcinica]|uniref:hypothetical protein n=1 Tax=Nocardia farcinica TaxID=37329 RepID=UPI001892E13E|nr:hypothetical protein [Nocardia farcinica]MBF6233140.1 hypothetical protein [Nocardia farcinica]MBF6252633.1 hypothetical protein [Nocardia farcinica]